MNDRNSPTPGQHVLFCPFCRDSFEGTRRCPDHELELVPWHALPRDVSRLEDDDRVSPYALVAGRGWLFLGAALTMAAFVMPMLTLTGETELHANMLRFASLRAGKLWMVPFAALAQVMILFRRRTPRGMRSVRLATAAVALMPLVALGVTLRGVWLAAAVMEARTGTATAMTFGAGCYVLAGAAVISLIGAARLGVQNSPAEAVDSTAH